MKTLLRVGLLGLIPFLPDRLRYKPMLGFGQPLADGLKFLLKEDYRPKNVDKVLFSVAPAVMIGVVIVSIAILPWGGWTRGTRTIDATGMADYTPAIRAMDRSEYRGTSASSRSAAARFSGRVNPRGCSLAAAAAIASR